MMKMMNIRTNDGVLVSRYQCSPTDCFYFNKNRKITPEVAIQHLCLANIVPNEKYVQW